MKKPNMNCGECPYYLAYGEPETTDEQNEAILKHCAECDACDGKCFDCDDFDSTTDKCMKKSEEDNAIYKHYVNKGATYITSEPKEREDTE